MFIIRSTVLSHSLTKLHIKNKTIRLILRNNCQLLPGIGMFWEVKCYIWKLQEKLLNEYFVTIIPFLSYLSFRFVIL